MSKTTTYAVHQIDAEGAQLKQLNEKAFAKKADAIEFARTHRAKTGEGVSVVTSSDKEVHRQLPKRTIKMSKPYTRVAALPEGVTVPKGLRVAYAYNRRGGVILHDPNAEKDEAYSIMLTKGPEAGTVLEDRFPTTRAAGDAMRDVRVVAQETVDA